jgi:pre-mRNA-processing factor 19
MFCAISGVAPEDPVASRVSGHVFSNRLILAALDASGGKCPITGKDLSADDLLPLVLPEVPRPVPASASTLPGLLKHMQAEWDALILDSHAVRKALANTRQELAHALYQYDAATRVIARVVEERDEARIKLALGMGNAVAAVSEWNPMERLIVTNNANGTSSGIPEAAIASVPANAPAPALAPENEADTSGGPMEADAAGGVDSPAPSHAAVVPAGPAQLAAEVFEKITIAHGELTSARKARKQSPDLASSKEIAAFTETHRVSVSSERSAVTAVELLPSVQDGEEPVVAAGCADGSIHLYSSTDLTTSGPGVGVGAPSAHEGGVTCFAQLDARDDSPAMLFSGGADGVICIWSHESLQATVKAPATPRSSLRRRRSSAGKPSAAAVVAEPMLRLTGRDVDGGDEEVIKGVADGVADISVHPAGGIVLSATKSGKWRIHDVKSGALLSHGSSAGGSVECCAVHPDGMIFGLGGSDGSIEMWELKQMKRVETLRSSGNAVPVQVLCMSENGYYMVAGGGGRMRVWDLRKLAIARESRIADGDKIADSGSVPACGVALDWSGSFCAATTGRGAVRVVETRKLRGVADFEVGVRVEDVVDGDVARAGIAWGKDAKTLFAGALDGSLVRIGAAVQGDEKGE